MERRRASWKHVPTSKPFSTRPTRPGAATTRRPCRRCFTPALGLLPRQSAGRRPEESTRKHNVLNTMFEASRWSASGAASPDLLDPPRAVVHWRGTFRGEERAGGRDRHPRPTRCGMDGSTTLPPSHTADAAAPAPRPSGASPLIGMSRGGRHHSVRVGQAFAWRCANRMAGRRITPCRRKVRSAVRRRRNRRRGLDIIQCPGAARVIHVARHRLLRTVRSTPPWPTRVGRHRRAGPRCTAVLAILVATEGTPSRARGVLA